VSMGISTTLLLPVGKRRPGASELLGIKLNAVAFIRAKIGCTKISDYWYQGLRNREALRRSPELAKLQRTYHVQLLVSGVYTLSR
jgi:hypothetical protein